MERENLSIASDRRVAASILGEQPRQREEQVAVGRMCRNPALELGDRLSALILLYELKHAILDRIARRAFPVAARAQLGESVRTRILLAPFPVRVGKARVVGGRWNYRRRDLGSWKRVSEGTRRGSQAEPRRW